MVKNRKQTRKWWNEFWNRSYIYLDDAGQLANPHGLDADDLSLVDPADSLAVAVRNYTLFRYMLGCNAYSKWPTKFNGGLFTFDPVWVNPDMAFTPDFRRWGGGTHTAQNQRLVYWPMLKNGDFDMMLPQFDYYLRILQQRRNAVVSIGTMKEPALQSRLKTLGCPIRLSMALSVRPLSIKAWNTTPG